MSWIFALLLTGYGLLRAALWIRGQLRLRLHPDQVVPRARPRPTPEHLSAGLAELFAATDALRVCLVDDIRAISILQITDPDAPLGHVRDTSFRWSVLDAWLELKRWRASAECQAEGNMELVWLHEQIAHATQRIDHAIEGIRPVWWQAVRARPLEPFPVEDVQRVRTALTHIVEQLERVQDRMARLGGDPYRGSVPAAQASVEPAR